MIATGRGWRIAVALLAGAAVTVAACSPARSAALNNTSWTLEAIGETAVPPSVEPTLVVRTGGNFTGFTGCNEIYGEAAIGPGWIEITTIAQTARACDDPAFVPFETDYVNALQAAIGWAVTGTTLTLIGPTDLAFAER